MHSSGLHYFDPRDESFTFINTIAENMKQFTKQQIQHAEVARSLYAKLSYPSMRDFKWVVQSNHFKDCPVTVQNINVAMASMSQHSKGRPQGTNHCQWQQT
jgi:hypothetical protein